MGRSLDGSGPLGALQALEEEHVARNTKQRRKKPTYRPAKKRVCIFCSEGIEWVDYKDADLLRRFISERAKIRARRVTGNCRFHQTQVAKAIKLARELALLPYAQRQVQVRKGKGGGSRGRSSASAPPPAPKQPPPPPRKSDEAEGDGEGSSEAADQADAADAETAVAATSEAPVSEAGGESSGNGSGGDGSEQEEQS